MARSAKAPCKRLISANFVLVYQYRQVVVPVPVAAATWQQTYFGLLTFNLISKRASTTSEVAGGSLELRERVLHLPHFLSLGFFSFYKEINGLSLISSPCLMLADWECLGVVVEGRRRGLRRVSQP